MMMETTVSELVRAHLPCKFCGSHDAAAEYTDHWHCFSCGRIWHEDGLTERKEIRMEEIAEGKIRESKEVWS